MLCKHKPYISLKSFLTRPSSNWPSFLLRSQVSNFFPLVGFGNAHYSVLRSHQIQRRQATRMLLELRSIPFCLGLSDRLWPPNYLSSPTITSRKFNADPRLASIRRPQILSSTSGDDYGSRVFVVSDLHTDYPENMAWVKGLSSKRHIKDVLLVAGDVAETFDNFSFTMSLLKDRFEHVFYVPGNHDLWCRSNQDHCLDSLEKLNKLLDACRELGVETKPMVIDDLGIIPLFSWYHESFDREEDITGIRIPSLEMVCKDYHACKWPRGLSSIDTSLALYFDAMNEENGGKIKSIQGTCSQIITFSHFVPRQELCPEKRMLFYPNLPKVIGSDSLEVRIRSIHGTKQNSSGCHVFGHTHFCWDATLNGIRYVQAPLAYPRERRRRMNGGENWLPFCIYSGGKFTDKLSPCYWSDYYAVNPRAPHITKLAPWVARFYNREQ